MADALLRVENLCAGYGQVQVVWGADLSVERGSIVCLVGSNGAGKSTLLRAISGLVRPTAGRVCLGNRDLTGASHPDNILIHHFSIGSRASRMAYALPDRMVLVYHNITPPEYFVDINKELVRLCFRGRRELALYKTRCDLACDLG